MGRENKNNKITEKKREKELATAQIDLQQFLKGPLPTLKKMSKTTLKQECEIWRRIWQWIPSGIQYYVARTGQQIGITRRDYKRKLGILLGTHWNLDSVELGVYEKTYDTTSGQWYFERKIVNMKIGGLLDIQWIKERVPEDEMTKPETEPEKKIVDEVEQEMLTSHSEDQSTRPQDIH